MEDDLKIMNEQQNQLVNTHQNYKNKLDELVKTFENSYEILEKQKINNLIKLYDRNTDLRDPINRAFNKYTQILDKLNEHRTK